MSPFSSNFLCCFFSLQCVCVTLLRCSSAVCLSVTPPPQRVTLQQSRAPFFVVAVVTNPAEATCVWVSGGFHLHWGPGLAHPCGRRLRRWAAVVAWQAVTFLKSGRVCVRFAADVSLDVLVPCFQCGVPSFGLFRRIYWPVPFKKQCCMCCVCRTVVVLLTSPASDCVGGFFRGVMPPFQPPIKPSPTLSALCY